jgi:hypothetical protein
MERGEVDLVHVVVALIDIHVILGHIGGVVDAALLQLLLL